MTEILQKIWDLEHALWKGIFICFVVGSPVFFVWGLMCLKFDASWFCLSRVWRVLVFKYVLGYEWHHAPVYSVWTHDSIVNINCLSHTRTRLSSFNFKFTSFLMLKMSNHSKLWVSQSWRTIRYTFDLKRRRQLFLELHEN